GHGNNGLGDFFTQVVFGRFLHFAQHVGRNLGRCQRFALGFDPGVAVVGLDDFVRHQVDVFLYGFFVELAANKALDGVQGVGRIGHGLTLGGCTDQDFAVLLVSHDGGGGTTALGVFNNANLATIEYSNTAVGGTKVDANDLA